MTETGILPDFIIIGAMKAGTTTLYEYLSRHPQVGMSREKETDFFIVEKNWSRGLAWYQGQFSAKAGPGRRVYGEASPNYTKCQAFPGVPERVAQLIPGCKLIFLARDPVARAESQYRHAVLSGVRMPAPAALLGTHQLQHLIDTSSYAAQLTQWMARFAREQFLMLDFESFVREPAPVLTKVARFLQIADEWPAASKIAANTSDSLARLPPWLFRLRQWPVADFLKRAMPARLRSRLKSGLQSGNAREAAGFDPAVSAYVRAALAQDTALFEQMVRQENSPALPT